MKRPALILALLALVAGGIAAALLLLGGKPQRGAIVALAPVSETEAVALVQFDADETQRFAVALIDAAKGIAWEVETTPNAFIPSLGRTSHVPVPAPAPWSDPTRARAPGSGARALALARAHARSRAFATLVETGG